MRWVSGIPMPLLLLIAALLEAGGDAVVRKALQAHALPVRIGFFGAGAALLFAYGVFLNLAPLDFAQVVGLYIAILFVMWQLITWFAFGVAPGLPILLGGTLIIAGGLLVSFWKPQ